jgi:hypothetical protein
MTTNIDATNRHHITLRRLPRTASSIASGMPFATQPPDRYGTHAPATNGTTQGPAGDAMADSPP